MSRNTKKTKSSKFKLLGIYVDHLNLDDKEISRNIKEGNEVVVSDTASYEIKYFNYKKKLNEGFFPFSNDLSFSLRSNDKLIFNLCANSLDIYSFSDNLKVNINGIVGKNGSGKSTLFELLYLMIYNLSIHFNKLTPTYPTANTAKKMYMPYLKSSLLYQSNEGSYRMITFDITECSLDSKVNSIEFIEGALENGKVVFCNNDFVFELEEFMYTIGLNYSIFGLNNNVMGDWIQQLFHKNDGYQTPVVLNPYKEDGEYSVNNELDISRDRILTNIMLTYESRNDFLLIDNYFLKRINFKLSIDEPKVKKESLFFKIFQQYEGVPEDTYTLKHPSNLYFGFSSEKKVDISKEKFTYGEVYFFLESFLGVDTVKKINTRLGVDVIFHGFALAYLPIINEVIAYTYYKLVKLLISYYDLFNKISNTDERHKDIVFMELLDVALKDKSHKTLKLRRSVNFLKNIKSFYKSIDYRKDYRNISRYGISSITPEQLYNFYKDVKENSNSNEKNISINEVSIPGCFKLDFIFNDDLSLNSLSSGELQKILSLQTIFYHLINLNSVDDSISGYNSYRNIIVLFDEIELYFHPEYQRTYINSLLELLGYYNDILKNIDSIQFIFSTHSPFILSDIPLQNILRLEEGRFIKNDLLNNSFAANIHDLLNEEFFLQNGTIGEYASQKIKKIVNKKVIEQKDIDIINLIGDPFLRGVIKKQISDKISSHVIKQEITRLQTLLKKDLDDATN